MSLTSADVAAPRRLRRELIAFSGVIERNRRLIVRHLWWELTWLLFSLATALAIAFIAKGFAQGGAQLDVTRETTVLVIGATMWSYLGMAFQVIMETVTWEQTEGTIEFTFMAPLSRATHLWGMSCFVLVYSFARAVVVFLVSMLLLPVDVHAANVGSLLLLLAVSSVSFVGLGSLVAVLPLLSAEKGTQMAFVVQSALLVFSGVYYPITVLPGWMQAIAQLSPATYALEGARKALIDGAGAAALWPDLWPLLVMGAVLVPGGLVVFGAVERRAKRRGTLRRSG